MSVTSAPEQSGAAPRVRDRAREALVLMTFSAAVSVGVALLLLVAADLGR